MRHTIRHDTTARTILAYLATHDAPVKAAQIVRYMALMHDMEPETVAVMLCYHAKVGAIRAVARGWYQRRWEIIQ